MMIMMIMMRGESAVMTDESDAAIYCFFLFVMVSRGISLLTYLRCLM